MPLPPIPDISEMPRVEAASALEAYAKAHFGKDLDKRRAIPDLLTEVQRLAAVTDGGGDVSAPVAASEYPDGPVTFYSNRENLTVQLGDTAIHFRKHKASVPEDIATRLAAHQLALFSHIFDGRDYAWINGKAVPKSGPVALAVEAETVPGTAVFRTDLPSLTLNMGPTERLRFEAGTLIVTDADTAERVRRHTLFQQGRIQEGM